MAKKNRFKLDMGNGFEVNDIDELREHFNLEKVMEYLNDGKFMTWLRDRYYETEASGIENLDIESEESQEQLCRILNVGWNVDYDDSESFQERLTKIRKYTNDIKIITNLHMVAFDQFELYDRLDQDYMTIYLCGETFTIPVSKDNITYIGINNPEVKVDTPDGILPNEKNIILKDVRFDIIKAAEYGNVDAQYELANSLEKDEKYDEAYIWYKKSAEQGHVHSILKVSEFFLKGKGVEKNLERALEWCEKISDENANIYIIKGDILLETNDSDKAFEYYQKALNVGCQEALEKIIHLAEKGVSAAQNFATEKMVFSSETQERERGLELFKNSVKNGNYKLLRKIEKSLDELINSDDSENQRNIDIELCNIIAEIYNDGSGVEKDIDSAIKWYSIVAEHDSDNREAKKVITKLANENHAFAQYTYCRNYAKDSEKVLWMEKSAKNGYDEAQYTMGLLYMTGNNVSKSNSTALSWFKKAAAQGHSGAKTQVGTQEYWYK